MKVSNFTGGIVTDVDYEDQPQNTVRDAVNLDLVPGKAAKRKGTEYHAWSEYTGSDANNLAYVGLLPDPGGDEEIIDIVKVRAPDARTDSVEGFPTFRERCLNPDVTVILTRIYAAGVATDAYHLYADIYAELKFVKIQTGNFGGGTEYTIVCADSDSLPYLVPRSGAVAIGNAKLFYSNSTGGGVDSANGVLWFGHIKKIVGWTRDATPGAPPPSGAGTYDTYEYLQYIDEWRLCNSECYGHDIKAQLMISDFGSVWNSGSPANGHLDGQMASLGYSAREALEEDFSEIIFGVDESMTGRQFRFKATLMYDGYQESRPIFWEDPRADFFATEAPLGTTAGNVNYGVAQMPVGWYTEMDRRKNQYMRLVLKDREPHCFAYDSGAGYDDYVGGTQKANFTVRMRWTQEFTEREPVNISGNTFAVSVFSSFHAGFTGGNSVPSQPTPYNLVQNAQGEDAALGIDLDYGRFVISTAKWGATWIGGLFRTVLILLGGDLNSIEQRFLDSVQRGQPDWGQLATDLNGGQIGYTMTQHEVAFFQGMFIDGLYADITGRQEYQFARAHWRVVETSAAPSSGSSTKTTQALYRWMQFSDNALADGNIPGQLNTTMWSFTFEPGDYSGVGLAYVKIKIPHAYMLEPSGSDNPQLVLGGRRITGYRIYIFEEEIDTDYRMIQDIKFDFNEADPDHGGYGEDDSNGKIHFRESQANPYNWKAPTFMDEGGFFVPFFLQDIWISGASQWGMYIVGGLNRVFMISDSDAMDSAGASFLSANLLRDEDESDAPAWTRGAIIEGRMLGISMKTNDIQYSVVSGGVAQYDIMPGDFNVVKGEKLYHIVSWRDVFHFVFTDLNIWRLDFSDGDVFNFRVIDQFAGLGTKYWRAIVNAPQGLFFLNQVGIFHFSGDIPNSMTQDRWNEEYIANWYMNLDEITTTGGYNPFTQRVYFSIDNSDKYVWVYDLRQRAWWKYQFAWGMPRLMKHVNSYFNIQAETPGAFFRHAPGGYVDYQISSVDAYGVYLRTGELQRLDEISLQHFVNGGVRYDAQVGSTETPAKVRVRLSGYNYDDDKSHNWIHLPENVGQHRFPLPFGIGRGFALEFGQGTYCGLSDVNSENYIQLSSFTAEGGQSQQLEGTFGGD